ncbi:MAG: hypothetical protein WBG43_08115 [Marinifilaceae bacterium]
MYDITYTVTTSNGSSINKIEYMNGKAELIKLSNVSSPWTINIRVRAGLALEAAAYNDIPYNSSLSIHAAWTPEGGFKNQESERMPNDTPNSKILNGKVEISGRTLAD